MKTHRLTADRSGERLDAFVARALPELSRSHVKRLLDGGLVTIGGRVPKASEKVSEGVGGRRRSAAAGGDEPGAAAHSRDDHLPGQRHHRRRQAAGPDGAPCARPPERHAGQRPAGDVPGPAGHRRDAAARHRAPAGQGHLRAARRRQERPRDAGAAAQLAERRVHKTYLALVHGVPKPARRPDRGADRAQPEEPQEDGDRRGRPRVDDALQGARGAAAATRCWKSSRSPGARTRSACTSPRSATRSSATRCTAGRRRSSAAQFLHAWKLAFAMPLGERQVEFESPLPADLREALEKVRDS